MKDGAPDDTVIDRLKGALDGDTMPNAADSKSWPRKKLSARRENVRWKKRNVWRRNDD